MAISSSLSPLSTLFSQVRRNTATKIESKASLHYGFSSNPQPKIKHQNHHHKKLSNIKFSGDFGEIQSIEADVNVPVDESSENELVISGEIDGFGFSEGGGVKEGEKQAAQRLVKESSNSQIRVSREIESDQIQTEIGECSRTSGMISKRRHQLEGFVREEEGIDPLVAPAFGLADKTEEEPAGRMRMHSVPREETSQSLKGVTSINEAQSKNNQEQHSSYNSSTYQDKENNLPFSKSANLNVNDEIAGEEPWWYCLRCVLGILLSGGESDGAPEGLYSLEVKPTSSNRNPTSHAITFEDRADATNFCYVLDSFFENLNDVSAEVIPLMIQEIKEEVQSGRLNLIVVPKGKLKLYAGQPLEEVETALCSFVA